MAKNFETGYFKPSNSSWPNGIKAVTADVIDSNGEVNEIIDTIEFFSLGTKETVLDENFEWPEGEALIGSCVYDKEGKLVGFCDTKSLRVNSNKTKITIDYNVFQPDLDNIIEGTLKITSNGNPTINPRYGDTAEILDKRLQEELKNTSVYDFIGKAFYDKIDNLIVIKISKAAVCEYINCLDSDIRDNMKENIKNQGNALENFISNTLPVGTEYIVKPYTSEDYTRIEYIEALDRGPWIQLDYRPTPNSGYEIKGQNNENSSRNLMTSREDDVEIDVEGRYKKLPPYYQPGGTAWRHYGVMPPWSNYGRYDGKDKTGFDYGVELVAWVRRSDLCYQKNKTTEIQISNLNFMGSKNAIAYIKPGSPCNLLYSLNGLFGTSSNMRWNRGTADEGNPFIFPTGKGEPMPTSPSEIKNLGQEPTYPQVDKDGNILEPRPFKLFFSWGTDSRDWSYDKQGYHLLSAGKIYHVKISEKDEVLNKHVLKHHYVPILDNENNPCLVDELTGRIYRNQNPAERFTYPGDPYVSPDKKEINKDGLYIKKTEEGCFYSYDKREGYKELKFTNDKPKSTYFKAKLVSEDDDVYLMKWVTV